MQYTVLINQSRALEWGLNAQQAMLFAFLYGCPAWAETFVFDDQVYFRLSKAKICSELPLLTDKTNTVHKLLKALESAGLILMEVFDNESHFSITEKGALWNQSEGVEKNPTLGKKSTPGMEKNPRGYGKKSTPGVEKNPPNQIISNQITKSDNQDKKINTKKSDLDFSGWPSMPSDQVFADYKKLRQAKSAPLTQTVINRLGAELKALERYGVTVDQALAIACERGWQGIKSEWILNHLQNTGGGHAANQQHRGTGSGFGKVSHSDQVRADAREALERLNGSDGNSAVRSTG